jgi:hypothetical protein
MEFGDFDVIWEFELREILASNKFLPDPLIRLQTIHHINNRSIFHGQFGNLAPLVFLYIIWFLAFILIIAGNFIDLAVNQVHDLLIADLVQI